MTPKKTTAKQKEYQRPPVEDPDEWELDDLRNDPVEEAPAVRASSTDPRVYKEVGQPTTPAPTKKAAIGYIVFAPFDLAGKHYEAGDTFTLPEGYARDAAADEFRGTSRKNAGVGQEVGMAIVHPPVFIPPSKEPTERTSIIPVRNAPVDRVVEEA